MPSVVIDNCKVEVAPGGTILDAARKLGLDIPTLCFAEGYRPLTSCMLCLVKLKNENRFVPSCATVVEDGMQVESETAEVWQVRRAGIDLLLSDHAGDCTAPCQNTCPCHMDIPQMLRQVAAGDLKEAIVTVKLDIALPAVLGRVCPEVCERTCRRSDMDSPAAICQVKRYVADADLESEAPYLPPRMPSTGKSVAIIGAGPAGLSAAYHLLQAGHACTLFDDQSEPGGMLRRDFAEGQLPRSVLDSEIAIIRQLGAVFQLGTKIGQDRSLASLREEFDAVLVAIGPLESTDADRLGLPVSGPRLVADTKTHETSVPGVFAAGDAVQPSKLVVRAVADGKAAALNIDQFLSGDTPTKMQKAFTVRLGRLEKKELGSMAVVAGKGERVVPSGGPRGALTDDEARAEAGRCLHCDCGRKDTCGLRRYAQIYGASPNRYHGTRRVFERYVQLGRDGGNVVFEPGKCIVCGLCIEIANEAKEPLGLTFIGRGFDVRVGVPFDRSIAEGLTIAAQRCVEACPTGALAFRSVPEHTPLIENK